MLQMVAERKKKSKKTMGKKNSIIANLESVREIKSELALIKIILDQCSPMTQTS